jgi:hypothetical protein
MGDVKPFPGKGGGTSPPPDPPDLGGARSIPEDFAALTGRIRVLCGIAAAAVEVIDAFDHLSDGSESEEWGVKLSTRAFALRCSLADAGYVGRWVDPTPEGGVP